MPSPSARPPAPPSLPAFDGRLFLAVEIPAPLRDALSAHLAGVPGAWPLPGRPVAPVQWHLTLRFLGDTGAEAGGRLVESLAGMALGEPFELTFGGLGAFPRADRAQVLWLGLAGGREGLRALAASVERAVVAAGFGAERRAFSGHLTLARLRPPADLRRLIAAVPPFDRALAVERVVLVRSQLSRGGPCYQALACFPLRGDAPAGLAAPIPEEAFAR